MSSRTLYGCIIFLRRECHSVCLFVGFSQDLSNGRAEQTSRFFRIYMSQLAFLIRQSGYFADESKSLCWNQLR